MSGVCQPHYAQHRLGQEVEGSAVHGPTAEAVTESQRLG
jgi:hypothetical protein